MRHFFNWFSGLNGHPNDDCFVVETESNETKKCIFPFTYFGVKYHGCIDKYVEQFWCATQVDDNLDYMEGQFHQR